MEIGDKNKDGKITKEELKFILSPAGCNEWIVSSAIGY